jgi:hypothetical protein
MQRPLTGFFQIARSFAERQTPMNAGSIAEQLSLLFFPI